jgi:multicomponent Na+:H+ antiporter subunit E
MRTWFLMNILLTLVWVALTGTFTYVNFTFGYLLSFGVIVLVGRNGTGRRYGALLPKAVGFVFFFLYQLIKANVQVAFDVVTPHNYMKPGIVRVPLDARTDLEITLLANVISLTPGTLSLDVSTDRQTLYVHAMYIESEEAFVHEIKNGFERRLLSILR